MAHPDPAEWARRASSFGAQAAAYDEHRPDYPLAALEWSLAPVGSAGPRVLDLGAGTGKLAGGLLALGLLDVLAVEPDAEMLGELTRRFPEVDARPGSAEDIPLLDDSVDAVLAGQAMHWFDLARALPEITRVLRPGGVLAGLWNRPDHRVDWVAEFNRMAHGNDSTADWRPWSSRHPLFGEFEWTDFNHRQRRTAETLVRTAATQSDMLIRTDTDRAERLATLRDYLAGRPETASGAFDLPLITSVGRKVLG